MPVHLEVTLRTSPDGPRLLHDAFSAESVSVENLRSLVPLAWCYHCLSAPERVIGSEQWVEMFRAGRAVQDPVQFAYADSRDHALSGNPQRRSSRNVLDRLSCGR
jgi:hypothetical protein